MNRTQINEFRAHMGLKPLQINAYEQTLETRRKRAAQANKAQRAQANRDMKAKRNKGGK